jgi:ATP-binding cassette subfamily F protein uup
MAPRPPLLSLKDVRLADGALSLFDGVEMALEPGAKACLVGRNGAGKSTLLKILAGRIQADSGDRATPPGIRIALVDQEPQIVGETLTDYASSDGAETYEAEAALEAFGLDPSRGTTGLSGGEARRAALAKALASQPDVLLLDEPTNHLDILAIEVLEQRLKQARFALLTVSHDRAFLEAVTNKCFWLEGRKVRRLDRGFAEFDAWADQVEAAEADEARRLNKVLERENAWLARGVQGRRARNEGRRRKLMELRAEKSAWQADQRGAVSMALESGGSQSKRIIEAKGLSKGFNGRTLIDNFSTRIQRGDRVAIVGRNGAGKSTLVKLLLGEIAADAGTVKLADNLQVVYVDQARAQLDPTKTLWDALTPLGGDQVMVRGQPRHVAGYAKDFLFTEGQLRQPVASLSGGERNRLLLAKALAQPADLLVLDEPTNDLDADTLDRLEDVLAEFDGVLLLVSHDRDFIDRLATSTIALDGKGHIVETPGGWKDFLEQNPDFLESRTASSSKRKMTSTSAPAPAAAAPRAGKLTYKDQRRLEELEKLVEAMPGILAALEKDLADPALYSRDPKRFDALMKRHTEAKGQLASAEDEWLALEEKRMALAGG